MMTNAASVKDETGTLSEYYFRHGFAVVRQCLSAEQIADLIDQTEVVREDRSAGESVSNSSGVFALRNLIDIVPGITALLRTPSLCSVVRSILGENAFLVRSTLFDKTDGANWAVFWHQDLSVAVQSRHEVDGFHAWTRKAGVVCVQPPACLMRKLLAVRLHLDECGLRNGPLRVLPGTHLQSRLSTAEIEQVSLQVPEVVCEVPAGGAVLMNPLTLHASSPMTVPGHRRVIHLEFANFELPAPLQWRYQLPVGPTSESGDILN